MNIGIADSKAIGRTLITEAGTAKKIAVLPKTMPPSNAVINANGLTGGLFCFTFAKYTATPNSVDKSPSPENPNAIKFINHLFKLNHFIVLVSTLDL